MTDTNRVRGKLRIRYEKHDEDQYVSKQFFSDGSTKMVRIILNPIEMTWHITDAVTGFVYRQGGDNINNFEVLQRSAKRALNEFLKLNLEKERRNVTRD